MSYGNAGPSTQLLPRGRHALVVDDVTMDGLITSSILRAEGYKVTVAQGGAEAIEAIIKGTFNIVLMDVRMPGIDGLEATRRIRQLGGIHATVPIVALSGMDFAEGSDEFFSAGMNGVMSKPIDPETLDAALLHIRRSGPTGAEMHSAKQKSRFSGDIETACSTRIGMHMRVTLPKDHRRYYRPGWAEFGMEGTFWAGLETICLAEGITNVEFIENAKHRRPDRTVGLAVRLEILLRLHSKYCPIGERPA